MLKIELGSSGLVVIAKSLALSFKKLMGARSTWHGTSRGSQRTMPWSWLSLTIFTGLWLPGLWVKCLYELSCLSSPFPPLDITWQNKNQLQELGWSQHHTLGAIPSTSWTWWTSASKHLSGCGSRTQQESKVSLSSRSWSRQGWAGVDWPWKLAVTFL